MTDKSARIRLGLSTGDFLGGLSNLTTQIQAVGKRWGEALREPAKKAFGEAKSALGDVKGELANATKFAIGFGGALSVGDSAKTALELEEVYKNLAFSIKAGTGEVVHFEEIQNDVQRTAGRWSRANEEVAASYKALYEDIGDVQFAVDASDAIAMIATATGESVDSLTGIAGTLQEKFGVAGEDIAASLATVYSQSKRGGLGLGEMAEKLGILGASAKQLGLDGPEGLKRVAAMANIAEGSAGSMRKAIASVTTLLDEMASPGKLKAIEKALGVKITGKDGKAKADAIEQIIRVTGGDESKIGKAFSGETQKLLTELGKTFKEGSEGTKGTKKEKEAAGLAKLREAFDAAGESATSLAEMEQQAIVKLETPKAQMTKALNELQNVFSSPEMIGAMKEMATIAPKLAHGMADLVSFTVDNPALAAAGYVGGRMAMSAGGSLMGSAASGLGTFTMGLFKSGSAAKSLGESGAEAGKELASLGGNSSAASKAISGLAKASGIEGIAGKGAAAATAATALAAVGVAAFETTTALLKMRDGVDQKVANTTNDIFFQTTEQMARARSPEERAAALARGKQAMLDSIGFFGGGEEASKGIKALDEAKQKYDLRDIKMPGAQAFEETMSRGAETNDKAAQAAARVAASLDRLANSVSRATQPSGSNGLPPAAPSKPGFWD